MKQVQECGGRGRSGETARFLERSIAGSKGFNHTRLK